MKEGDVTLVDVRGTDEYVREHIPGAVSMPMDILSEESVSQLETSKVVMQCNTGGRSSRACAAADDLDTGHDMYSLDGGIVAWKDAGNETVKTEKAMPLPVNRQVQIGAGSLIVTGVALGYFVDPAFYLLSLFVGFGLLGAGTTGWCGMAELLSRAPWNKANE